MSAIVTSGLSKTYRARGLRAGRGRAERAAGVLALSDLSIEVREGEIFGFLGPNGAGKSTCIRILLGFLHPTGGSATVLGQPVVGDAPEFRRRVGYLPGGISFYDTMTGEALLDYLARLYGRGSPRRRALLDRLELSNATLRRPVRDYSRGMRQKLGIMQALQHDPELAILDEPSEGLDPLMQHAFYDILDELRRDGRTIFFSSHVLSEVERVCDRVAIIRTGRLVALSDVEELLRRRRRSVELRVEGPLPSLDSVPGVSGIEVRDNVLSCQLEGEVGPFLAAIAGAQVIDLTIEPARLEDAFLEFYAPDAPDAREALTAPDAPDEADAPDGPAALASAPHDAGAADQRGRSEVGPS